MRWPSAPKQFLYKALRLRVILHPAPVHNVQDLIADALAVAAAPHARQHEPHPFLRFPGGLGVRLGDGVRQPLLRMWRMVCLAEEKMCLAFAFAFAFAMVDGQGMWSAAGRGGAVQWQQGLRRAQYARRRLASGVNREMQLQTSGC